MLISAVGCGPLGSEGDVDAVTDRLGVSAAPAACADGVLATDRHRFKYVGVTVLRSLCKPVGPGAPVIVATDDETGALVDMASLEEADRASFHGWHASIESGLRAKLEEKPAEAHDVYVWFYVDESDAPDKEWLVGEPAAAITAAATRESRMRAAAAALSKKVSALSQVDLLGNVNPPQEYGIPVMRLRAKLADLDAIGSWPEVWRIDQVPTEHATLSDDYYNTTFEGLVDYWFGYDGSGVTVATYEGAVPDSWVNLPGTLPGNCQDFWGATSTRKCHCDSRVFGAHPRAMMGIVRRNTGILGMANAATTIMANHSGGCTTHGSDIFASALNWATANGARVISHSGGTGNEDDPNAHDRFFDYKASVSPWPFIAGASDNVPAINVTNKLRNGVCVGGGRELSGSNRGQVVWADTSYTNGTASYEGFELPHLVAIADYPNTAGFWANTSELTGGSSAATAEVAGIAASLYEANTALQSWPEVMVPGLMASANEDVDGVVLNLHDNVDDRDGAGLINAYQGLQVLQASSKVNGLNSPARAGHDYGGMSSGLTPEGTFYSEAYVTEVPVGAQLRVVSLLQARPTCPQNPGSLECSADPYPNHILWIQDGTQVVALSWRSATNYQYVALTNTSGVVKNYTIFIYLSAWNGLSSTTWGLAWSSW